MDIIEDIDNLELDKPGFTFSCSVTLMEAVRKLDYKQQYKVCSEFYETIINYPQWDNNRFCLFFDEVYERISPKGLDEQILRIHQCVNEMDNAISEIDDFDPMTFIDIEKRLVPVILKAQKSSKGKKK